MFYLPPEGSARNIDVNDFMTLFCYRSICIKMKKCFFFCGDLNSRISDTPDLIEGVDDVTEREQ